MDCLKTQELLDAYVDLELPPDRAEQVHSHLALCSVCSNEEKILQNLTTTLGNLPEIHTPKTLQRRIFKAFRAELQKQAIARPWHGMAFYADGLICCMALIGFGLGLFLGVRLLALPAQQLLLVAGMEGIWM